MCAWNYGVGGMVEDSCGIWIASGQFIIYSGQKTCAFLQLQIKNLSMVFWEAEGGRVWYTLNTEPKERKAELEMESRKLVTACSLGSQG